MCRLPAALPVIALGMLCASVAAQVAPAPEWGIEQLMQGLGQVKSARSKFVERKYLAILNAPLEFSGTLVYTAPDRLEKRTLARFYAVSLDGNSGEWRLSLVPRDPAMQAVVREIRISGSQNRIGTIEVIEPQGDRTVTMITRDAP